MSGSSETFTSPSENEELMLKRFYKSLFIPGASISCLSSLSFCSSLAYGIPFLFTIAQLFLLFLAVVTLLDYVVLFATRRACGGAKGAAGPLSVTGTSMRCGW
jgi:dolichyl-phosphate-mannose--protein O-mannosyl transferase